MITGSPTAGSEAGEVGERGNPEPRAQTVGAAMSGGGPKGQGSGDRDGGSDNESAPAREHGRGDPFDDMEEEEVCPPFFVLLSPPTRS